jgi:hypothetical protein
MKLIWKLLRQHISIPQFAGFFFANLFGMLIVLLGFQFYRDILPVFTSEDTFMKADYLIISKKISTTGVLSTGSDTFSDTEYADMAQQPFTKRIGKFISSEYKVNANMSINGVNVLSTEMFFESIPDSFVDVPLDGWHYTVGSDEVPVILPRTYITMYNFGFAQSKKLPKISDGLVSLINMQLSVHGAGKEGHFKGKVIGFSNRLNTVLVPEEFIQWSNKEYAPDAESKPTRLIVEVGNPADDHISSYIEKHGYEVDADKLNAEKTTYFLRLVVSMVLVVGLIISVLSFYILMLSIYLLVQKNSDKLKNLLIIGYRPGEVALPYQLLTIGLNILVLVIALVILVFVRNYYMNLILSLFPELDSASMTPALTLGLALLLIVSLINIFVIRHKLTTLR